MKKRILFLFIIITVFVYVFMPSNVAHAETIIGNGSYSSIDADQVWTKANSPYIISGMVFVYGNVTVEPGVEIYGVKNSSNSLDDTLIIGNKRARFIVKGSRTDRVKIKDLKQIQVTYDATAIFENTDISNIGSEIYFYRSNGIIATSTIRDSDTALKITSSTVSVYGSRIENNHYGVWIVGNYRYPVPIQSAIHINNNVFLNKYGYSVKNDSTEYADFKNNWWGTEGGPNQGASYIVNTQLVQYSPWLESEPPFDPEPIVRCCSSVLFIPGLQASRLYRDESHIYGTSTNKLWDPISNEDVRKLYLDKYGNSIDTSIYSGAPIDSVFGKDIYGSFMARLDQMKKDSKIGDWKYFGYDWRKSIEDVVLELETKASSTESILQLFQSMAEKSDTGKVTIVAHSNGGLVMKYLVKKLNEMDKSELVDKVISVAVPYLGTPKSILSILHGYDQSILGGLILKESTARELGRNMASAYTLLPSVKYFENILKPSIVFASTTVVDINEGEYSRKITSNKEQNNFIVDSQNSRVDPVISDTSRPIVGNGVLIGLANYIHGILDPFVWPANIASYAIVGWGNYTPTGISYDNKEKCSGIFMSRVCKYISTYRSVKTKYGDGTVVAGSAMSDSDEVVSLRIGDDAVDEEMKDIDHANILSSNTTQDVVEDIVIGRDLTISPTVSKGSMEDWDLRDDSDDKIIVSTHSPVRLDIYDEYGNHTGEISGPTGIEEGLYIAYETKIPGSDYERVGDEEEPDTYITLKNDGRNYTTQISGTGTGEFTYNIERVVDGEVIEKAEFRNIPTTPISVAYSKINNSSSSPSLALDMDGDGTYDMNISEGQDISPKDFLDMIRKALSKLDVKDGRVNELLKKLEHIEKSASVGKYKQSQKMVEVVIKKVGHKNLNKEGNISESDREVVLNSIRAYLESL